MREKKANLKWPITTKQVTIYIGFECVLFIFPLSTDFSYELQITTHKNPFSSHPYLLYNVEVHLSPLNGMVPILSAIVKKHLYGPI